MAEARRAVELREEFKRGIELAYDGRGIHVDIRCTIPPPAQAYRRLTKYAKVLQRRFYNSLFPYSLPVFLATVAVVVAIVLNASPDSWWRNGWLAHAIWNFGMMFPWVEGTPRHLRIGVLATWSAVIGFILLATLQRALLRLLLSHQAFLYHPHGKPAPLSLKLWFMLVKFLGNCGGRPSLYSYQASLPTLPIPDLEQTCEKYLEHTKALHGPRSKEFETTKRNIKKFLEDEGPRLQRYLRLKWWFSTNYVTDWWEKYVYLRSRTSILINSNYYVLDSGRWTPSYIQEARAAAVVHGFLQYKSKLEDESLPPILINKTVPLCMWQFERMFSTTRIPGRECDEIVHWDPEDSRHIAVLCEGRLYAVPVYTSNGQMLTPAQLQLQFAEIKADALEKKEEMYKAETRIPALTTEHRATWAEIRELYFSEGLNRRSLNMIDSAILFLHLDQSEFDLLDWTGRGRSVMHGNGADRWLDKSVSLVVHRNGKVGVNGEHAWADAPVLAHMMEMGMILVEKIPEEVYEEDGNTRGYKALIGDSNAPAKDMNKCSEASGCGRNSIQPWYLLKWALSRPAEEAIVAAHERAKESINDLDLNIFAFSDYGKGFMKKCRVSPDAYVQMAMQLAYYRDQKAFAATYEASMTRLFKHGRTETVRPLCEESVDFVHSMDDSSVPEEQKLEKLQKAASRHVNAYQEAMGGYGIDRHLFALYVVSVGKEIDSPFLKDALSVPWKLSTSQQPQQQTDLWDIKDPKHEKQISPGGGFGPVADDGYGVSYMIAGETEIFFHVSSKISRENTSSDRFAKGICQALRDMKELLGIALDRKQK